MATSDSTGSVSVARFMVDANVDNALGMLLASKGYEVAFVNQTFLPGTPDAELDLVARRDGWIVVSHDQQFMRRIQQSRFNFSDPVSTGYGRLMLCTRESQQVARFEQTLDLIELLLRYALAMNTRLVISIGANWVRFDDMPLVRHG